MVANQAVRIYDLQKPPDGKWKFILVDFEIDPAKTIQQLCYKLGIKGFGGSRDSAARLLIVIYERRRIHLDRLSRRTRLCRA
jgi:hypothetical protein